MADLKPWLMNPNTMQAYIKTLTAGTSFWLYVVLYSVCWFVTTSDHQMYIVRSLMDANCNLLGYWWHHSICYTGLFTTPRVVITSSPYNEAWPSDALSRSGPWISCGLNAGSWLTGWLLLTDWLLVTHYLLSRSTPLSRYIRTGYRTPSLMVYLPSQQFGYLRNA
jgi:hypothetical protein